MSVVRAFNCDNRKGPNTLVVLKTSCCRSASYGNEATLELKYSSPPGVQPYTAGTSRSHDHETDTRPRGLCMLGPGPSSSLSPPTHFPLQGPISSLVVIWLTNSDLLAFKPFSSLPCKHMRKRQASLWHNILSPSNSRVATLSRPLLAFCKIKHRHSSIFKEAIKS